MNKSASINFQSCTRSARFIKQVQQSRNMLCIYIYIYINPWPVLQYKTLTGHLWYYYFNCIANMWFIAAALFLLFIMLLLQKKINPRAINEGCVYLKSLQINYLHKVTDSHWCCFRLKEIKVYTFKDCKHPLLSLFDTCVYLKIWRCKRWTQSGLKSEHNAEMH